jgi:hypothetical protein
MGPNIREQASNWPTPAAQQYGGTAEQHLARKAKMDGGSRKTITELNAYVGQWPTPSATVMNDGEAPETWHARAQMLKAKHTNGNGAGLPLTVAAVQWPTPAARDHKSANSAEHALETGGGRKHMDQLSNFVAHSSHQAQPTAPGQESSSNTPTSPRHSPVILVLPG